MCLAIGAALLGAKHITALDLDEVAVRAAQENVTYNHADDRITVLKGNLLDSIEEPPDMIIANILAEVIMSFSKMLINSLNQADFSLHRVSLERNGTKCVMT